MTRKMIKLVAAVLISAGLIGVGYLVFDMLVLQPERTFQACVSAETTAYRHHGLSVEEEEDEVLRKCGRPAPVR